LKSALKAASNGGRAVRVAPAMAALQGRGGNQLVQRLVSWSRPPSRHWAGDLEVVRVDRSPRNVQRQAPAVGDPVVDQAKLDLPKFQAGVYARKNHTVGLNGKFDVTYRPLAKKLDIAVRVKFDFKGAGWNVISRVTSMVKFMTQAQSAWTAKHQLGNVRPPADVWGKALNPVTVNVRVVPVTTNQHFIVRFHKKAGGAQVAGGVTDLFKGDLDPNQKLFNPVTAQGELARVKRINPSPVLFDHDSAAIPPAFVPKLNFLTDYLKRINNPPFNLDVKGFASSVGPEEYNKKLAEKRAKAVEDHLTGAGLTNHTISHNGIGEVAGGHGAPFRKADIHVSIPAGWQNTFSTVPHEFGHMLGLGDEYQGAAGTVATHHGLVAKHFGKQYADQTVKRGDVASAGIMHFGEEVRIHHYVTFWDALAQATAAAAVPVPPFTHADWKLLE
jgi:outer membrane protein OmpA-like peptidoglycan-associated protein